MKIFFSQLGVTDPIRQDYKTKTWSDGPMISIVKKEQPQKVYLFYTKELIDEAKNKDEQQSLEGISRYKKAVLDACENCIVEEIIPETPLTEPHLFDNVLCMQDYVKKIYAENKTESEDVEIVLNLSSGTPAMIAMVALMAAELPYCRGIQVATPLGKSNLVIPELKDILEGLKSKRSGSIERCKDAPLKTINNFSEKNQISALIKAYKYSAAYDIACAEDSTIHKSTRKLLQFGELRSKLKLYEARKKLNGNYIDKMYPIKGDPEKLYEYFLVMQMLERNKDLSELLTKITPYMFDLLLEHVKRNIPDFNFESYCSINDDNKENIIYTMVREKMDKECKVYPNLYSELQEKFSVIKDRCEAGFYNLFLLCSCECLKGKSDINDRLVKRLSSLKHENMPNNSWTIARRINILRNAVAHHIIDVDETKFTKSIGIKPKDLIELMFDVLCLVFEKNYERKVFEKSRYVYDDLNECIKETYGNIR